MALFKIFRGPEEGLSSVPKHDGYAYFTTDQGNLYIDVDDGGLQRVKISSKWAEGLRKVDAEDQEQITYLNFDDIQLKSATQEVVHGGTGLTTLTPNAVLIGNGTSQLKMVTIDNNSVVVGDSTSGIKGLTGTGILYRLTDQAPQFGVAPISVGGTGGKNATEARTNLEVYSKQETDKNIEKATSVSYTATLNASNWQGSDGNFTYSYSNTELKCGNTGDIPPVITFTSNKDEYSKIESAVAEPGEGITFTTKERPSNNIDIIIIDVK